MKAKETVMSPKKREKVFENYPCLDPSFEDDYKTEVDLLLEAQAEISFKAGYQEGLKQQGTPLADAEIRLADKQYAELYRKAWAEQEVEVISFKVGKKAGIKEAGKLLETIKVLNEKTNEYVDTTYYIVDKYQWQAKLKEWEV